MKAPCSTATPQPVLCPCIRSWDLYPGIWGFVVRVARRASIPGYQGSWPRQDHSVESILGYHRDGIVTALIPEVLSKTSMTLSPQAG